LGQVVIAEDKTWIAREKRIFSGSQAHHALAGARRARIFDRAADRYIAEHPGCTVVNLGCGFDTRYWRIDRRDCRYIEVDLLEIVAMKEKILEDRLEYELVACSVLDPSWIEQVTSGGNSRFLLLAEGLFPYLPEPDAVRLFQMLTQRFFDSQLVLDIIPRSYTRGLLSKLIGLETHYTWGVDIPWVYGIKNPSEIETYAPGLKVIGVEKGSAGPVITVALPGSSS